MLAEIHAAQKAVGIAIHKKRMSDVQPRQCVMAIGQIGADLRILTAKAAHGTGA